MAPPKKYKGETVMYSYRSETEKWRIFNALLSLRGETPTDIFTKTVDEYIEEHKHLLGTALKELENK